VKAVDSVLERADEGRYGGRLVTTFLAILRDLGREKSWLPSEVVPSSIDDGFVIDATAVECVALLRLAIKKSTKHGRNVSMFFCGVSILVGEETCSPKDVILNTIPTIEISNRSRNSL